ncbi:MAG: 30S ribosomal protein S2, partial [Actinomycetia bacterium]|nr:30S ribosomal protein S2 [Actinomycetes bacterium]
VAAEPLAEWEQELLAGATTATATPEAAATPDAAPVEAAAEPTS